MHTNVLDARAFIPSTSRFSFRQISSGFTPQPADLNEFQRKRPSKESVTAPPWNMQVQNSPTFEPESKVHNKFHRFKVKWINKRNLWNEENRQTGQKPCRGKNQNKQLDKMNPQNGIRKRRNLRLRLRWTKDGYRLMCCTEGETCPLFLTNGLEDAGTLNIHML